MVWYLIVTFDTIFRHSIISYCIINQHKCAHAMKHIYYIWICGFCRFKDEVAENEDENGKNSFVKYFDAQGSA